jgi:branched-chain amino acid transport system substrate-binding protein
MSYRIFGGYAMTWRMFLTVLVALTTVGSGAAFGKEFTVGVQLSMTGPTALAGGEMYRGIQVAAELFNRQHPKHKIKLIVVDDESNAAKAVAAVEKLTSQGAVAIVGSTNSNLAGPASMAASKAGVVYATTGGTSDELVNRGLKNFFRLSSTPGYAAGLIGLFSEMGVKSLSVVYSTKEATADLAQKVSTAMKGKGVKVYMHPFDPSISDFKPILNKVKLQDRSEAIAMIGYENDYVGILRAGKVIKPDVRAIAGPWALATPKMSTSFGDLLPNVYGALVLPYPADYSLPGAKSFAETYKKLFKADSNYHSQTTYVLAQLLFDAIVRANDAGTLAKGGLADEMRRTKQDNTFLGRVTFDGKGDNPNYRAHMGQFKRDGTIAVVWPREHATMKMNYPAVPW